MQNGIEYINDWKKLPQKFKIWIRGDNNTIKFTQNIPNNIEIICSDREFSPNTLCSNNIIELDNISLWQGGKIFISCQKDNNKISIGDRTYINNHLSIMCKNGSKVKIGKKCLIANTTIYGTDYHHVIDNTTKLPINEQKVGGCIIGDHCWLCNGTVLLKNCKIGDDCVVALNAVMGSNFEKEHNVIIGGNPAQIIKRNINWKS